MPLVKRRQAGSRGKPQPRLDAGSADQRRAAALASAGDPVATPALLATLVSEPAREVRVAIVTALIAIGTEEAAAGLVGLLRADDIGLRNDALEALRRIGTAAAAPLRAALADPDPDRRLFAIQALGPRQAGWARDRLRALLAVETEVNVGLAAVNAMAEFGNSDDLHALHDFAARFPAEPMVGFAVRHAVDQLGAAR
jgi:HEAT repeat protein